MACSSCQDNPNPLSPTEINCGYCYWQGVRINDDEPKLGWIPFTGTDGKQISTCKDDCVCQSPNFLPGDDFIRDDVIAVKCLRDIDKPAYKDCCEGKCIWRMVYKNPLMPQLGKKWIKITSTTVRCNDNCDNSYLHSCNCLEPNIYPNMPIGFEAQVFCTYALVI